MSETSKEFYGSLAGDRYLKEIRRFGLRYDEMVNTLTEIVAIHKPKRILDMGCGVGNVDEIIMKKLPGTELVAVDLAPEMADVARTRLNSYENAEVICADILKYTNRGKFDAIITNLALHNLDTRNKIKVLRNSYEQLNHGGLILWGDFMDWHNTVVSDYFMETRKRSILETGVDKAFAEKIFAKEQADHRITTVESVSLLRSVGYSKPDILWVWQFLAICSAKRT